MEPPATNRCPPVIEMLEVTVGTMHDPGSRVADKVNWTVEVGDYWVVAGLQGSGKSDFMLMTGGLMPPLSGVYHLFGETMPIFEEARLPTRLRLGLVFDGGQLLHHLTVWENIALPLQYHRNVSRAEVQDRVHGLLEAVELTPWADHSPGRLSRNWHKRVGLARALILEPEVLLVDNPLAGLDLRHTHWWLACLDELSKGHALAHGRPLTLVVTGSDLRPWEGRACQFAALKSRRLTILGTWGDLVRSNDEWVRELLNLRPNA